jgi:hypothetical protein
MTLGRYHCEQSYSNSCLAACIVMARLRTGELPPGEASTHENQICEQLSAGRGGILIQVAAEAIGSSELHADPDRPETLLVIRADLASGQWWHIAIMGSGPLAEHHHRVGLSTSSRHGPLSHPVGPPHAVMLVATEPASLLYLDPWLPEPLQPQRMTTGEFARAWTGIFIPVHLAA